MQKTAIKKSTLAVLAIALPLVIALGYVAMTSGPLAAVEVTLDRVENRAISPALFGVGVIQARYSYRIGPIMTGQVLRLSAEVGDHVAAGQVLGEMDPVDMDNKIVAKSAAIKRANAAVIAAQAQVTDSDARAQYANSQSQRYQQLVKVQSISKESAEAKAQENQIAVATLAAAQANLNAVREELEMLRADYNGLQQQRSNLLLKAPVDGLVVGRYIEPGSTVVAGQTVLEIIDPASIWVNVRFDQLQSSGLSKGLRASIVLRSNSAQRLSGRVARVEPLADAVTQEILAKIVFDQLPDPLPPLGELTEVTVALPQLMISPVISNASIRRINGQTGVWLMQDDQQQYAAIEVGATDLDGRVQVTQGIKPGDSIILYSKQELTAHSRIKVVDHLLETSR